MILIMLLYPLQKYFKSRTTQAMHNESELPVYLYLIAPFGRGYITHFGPKEISEGCFTRTSSFWADDFGIYYLRRHLKNISATTVILQACALTALRIGEENVATSCGRTVE
jgi:hypothetical protein